MQSALSNSQMTLCILSEIAENVANWWFRAQGLRVPKVRFSVEEDTRILRGVDEVRRPDVAVFSSEGVRVR